MAIKLPLRPYIFIRPGLFVRPYFQRFKRSQTVLTCMGTIDISPPKVLETVFIFNNFLSHRMIKRKIRSVRIFHPYVETTSLSNHYFFFFFFISIFIIFCSIEKILSCRRIWSGLYILYYNYHLDSPSLHNQRRCRRRPSAACTHI